MNSCKGGRGKVAPYETTHVRVPLPVKTIVDKIVTDYRESGVIPNLDKPVNGFKSKDEVAKFLEDMRKSRKRLSIENINQILELIYGGYDCG